jgi:DNA-binding transcriptional MerR regulator
MFEVHQSDSHRSDKKGFSAPEKLYRIGEVVRHTPYSRQTIHNYTIMGLIKESSWTDGGHRLYDASVFEKLSQIAELRKTKTLGQVRDLLHDSSN